MRPKQIFRPRTLSNASSPPSDTNHELLSEGHVTDIKLEQDLDNIKLDVLNIDTADIFSTVVKQEQPLVDNQDQSHKVKVGEQNI